METLTKNQLEKLVNRIFNDLLDDLSLGERSLVNGDSSSSKNLYKETIRMKHKCLEELQKLDAQNSSSEKSKVFRSFSVEIRKQSLSLVQRMSELGY